MNPVALTPYGLGGASLGNLYRPMDADRAAAIVDAAWSVGIRYFDTAPHYGLGLSEVRLGAALGGRPRAQYRISSKVGRLLVPDPAGAGRRDSEGFAVPAGYRRVWDFSAEGVRRSLADSLERLGLDRLDVVLLHDPERHTRQALVEAYPELERWRAQGTVGAIGVGSTDTAVLERFVAEADLDMVLVAGRYTLLEQPALDRLLPSCQARGTTVINAGVFNSGLLAVDRPHAGLPYDYAPVPPATLRRAQDLAEVCARYGVSLAAAALAFAGAHPAIGSVLLGVDSPEQLRRNMAAAADLPGAAFWAGLRTAGLLRPGVPAPAGAT